MSHVKKNALGVEIKDKSVGLECPQSKMSPNPSTNVTLRRSCVGVRRRRPFGGGYRRVGHRER